MIFTELILHNFGIYKGRHTVDLSPSSKRKPIILFGGLNGGGKTTMLDALQLTLFGKFANVASRDGAPYDTYLRDMINRHVNPKEGSALELAFSRYENGIKQEYRIKRYWRTTGKSLKETLEVLSNGELDPVLSEQWYECVDEFIPSSVSSLFFFDGEQIAQLADPSKAKEIIRTGIYSLLGLGIVERLQEDLVTIARRRSVAKSDRNWSLKLEQANNDVNELTQKQKEYIDQVASKKTELDQLNNLIKKIKKEYRKVGGDLFENREFVTQQYELAKNKLLDNESKIKKFAESKVPLCLIEDLINSAHQRSTEEHSILKNRFLIEMLDERDKSILAKFHSKSANKIDADFLRDFLEADLKERRNIAETKTLLETDPVIFKHYERDVFSNLRDDANELLKERNKLDYEISALESQISSIPPDETIQQLALQLRDAETKRHTLSIEIESLKRLDDNNFRSLELRNRELDRLYHKVNEERLDNSIDKHVVQRTKDVDKILSLFKAKLVGKHIDRLQNLIKESFTDLVRKNDLVNKVRINDDFSIDVIGYNEEVIPTNRLSAGERQLLAISILWGLAKASGQPLPAIIDTPLGRLDSEHREHLISNYFPNASHQVILLSTDTEIDCENRDALAKSIGKEYHIQYDQSLKTSTISAGYF